jgi:hypothetical protein
MITLLELQSAFDLADDNDDGLITFEEAMEAVESAFSGTQFHGAEMIRDTLLLSNAKEDGNQASSPSAVPSNVTLQELALLSARGLKHESNGPTSALGTIQHSLDEIIDSCFAGWATTALSSSSTTLQSTMADVLGSIGGTSETEWQRVHGGESQSLSSFSEYMELPPMDKTTPSPIVGSVSPYIVGYFLSVASILNRNVCPSDSMAAEGGSSMMAIIRQSLLKQTLCFVSSTIQSETAIALENREFADGCASALIQVKVDFSFVQFCLMERNKHGFAWREDESSAEVVSESEASLKKVIKDVNLLIMNVWASSTLESTVKAKHHHVMEVSALYLTSLLGEEDSAIAESMDVTMAGSGTNVVALNPLPSSRRFGLLPIQESDRSLAELQRRGNKHDKEESSNADSSGGGVIGSGLGFFSSMLKKK